MKTTLLLLLTLLLTLAATAAPRTNLSRIDGTKHSTQELANADQQAVIDSTRGWITLGAAAVRKDSVWMQNGDIRFGYPSLLTVVLVCSTGTVSCNWAECYDAWADTVTHHNGDNVLWSGVGAGEYSKDVPFLGGKYVRFWWTAGAGGVIFHPAYQLMRD